MWYFQLNHLKYSTKPKYTHPILPLYDSNTANSSPSQNSIFFCIPFSQPPKKTQTPFWIRRLFFIILIHYTHSPCTPCHKQHPLARHTKYFTPRKANRENNAATQQKKNPSTHNIHPSGAAITTHAYFGAQKKKKKKKYSTTVENPQHSYHTLM